MVLALHSQIHYFLASIPPEELSPLEGVRDGKTNIILNGIFLHYYHGTSLNSALKPTAPYSSTACPRKVL